MEEVDHPKHYGGDGNIYECILVIDAWQVSFCIGSVLKYLCRAGLKSGDVLTDLRKASWFLQHEIERLEKGNKDGRS